MSAPAAVAQIPSARPSRANLAERVARQGELMSALRAEIRAGRREGLAFAEGVRAHAMRVHLAAVADRPDLALHEGAAIVALADRHIRQRGGAA